MGCNVWNRSSQKLRSPKLCLDPRFWIAKPHAFAPIVDQQLFELAQLALPKMSDSHWTDEEILRRVRRLLKAKGRLSETLILKARGMPPTTTIHERFGSYRQLYEKVGYQLEPQYVFTADQ